jgi:hypothetical protein
MFNDIDFVNARANEAVNEDFSTQRRVIEAFRRQVVKMDEHVQEQAQPMDKSEFNKIFISFKSTVDEYINKLDTDLESITSVPNLLYRYNLLANQLSAMGYNKTLNYKNKEDLNFDLNDIIPRLEELQRYADFYDFKDKETVDKIVNNFQTKQFKQITPSVKLSKISKLLQAGENIEDIGGLDIDEEDISKTKNKFNEITDYINGLTGIDSRFFTQRDFTDFRDIKKGFTSIKKKFKFSNDNAKLESILTDVDYSYISDTYDSLQAIDERVKDNEFTYNDIVDNLKQIKTLEAKQYLRLLNKSESFDPNFIDEIYGFIRQEGPANIEDLPPPPPPPEIEQEEAPSSLPFSAKRYAKMLEGKVLLRKFQAKEARKQKAQPATVSPFGVQYNPEEGPADIMGLQPELD